MNRIIHRFSLCALALLGVTVAAPALAQQTIPLANGQGTNFAMPAGSFTNAFVIDVGTESTLKLEVSSTDAGADLDILLRFGSAFPDLTLPEGLPPDPTYLFEHAQYRSTSSSASESITIGTYNRFPVRAGRWYVSVLNFTNRQVPATITATRSNTATPAVPIELVFDDASDGCGVAGWNDSTARAAVAGNSGTTLGQQRRNAITEAARLIGNDLKSPVPVRIQACWNDLGTGNSVTLASAGPRALFVRDYEFAQQDGSEVINLGFHAPWLTRNTTFFAAAPNGKLSGARLCGSGGGSCTTQYDVRAQFNTNVDTSSALGDRSFYYGFTQATTGTASADTDFISVAMHEITHGLGFIGLVNKTESPDEPVGAKFEGRDDIYDVHVGRIVGNCLEGSCQILPFLSGTNADRATAMTSFSNLRWNEAEAIASDFNVNRNLPAPQNTITLNAPNPIVPGSTLSHIANATEAGSLMLAQAVGKPHALGLALPMMNQVGWGNVARAVPAVIDPFSALYFDPKRPGHGIAFTKVTGNIYALTFYTYGAAGEPEWYIAIGPLVDGVFLPGVNANGDSLVRYRFVAGGNPQQQPDPSVSGALRLDFNEATIAPACNDGTARPFGTGPIGVMTYSIGTDRNLQWCMVPLLQPPVARPTVDFTGGYAAVTPADSGWGFSLQSFRIDASAGMFGLLFYPDTNGNGRWAYLQSTTFASGTQLPLVERRGYCRTCAVPAAALAGQFDDRNAGTITLTLTQPTQEQDVGNRTNLNVTYQTTPGGNFTRNTPIRLLSTPVPPP